MEVTVKVDETISKEVETAPKAEIDIPNLERPAHKARSAVPKAESKVLKVAARVPDSGVEVPKAELAPHDVNLFQLGGRGIP